MNRLTNLPPQKRIASLFLLPQCDMSCRFCASESSFSVMAYDQATALLEVLANSPVENVVLGGGEPFLWPHGLERLAVFAREMGFAVQVCTNGVSMPRGFERLTGIDRFILPIESTDPGTHDELRQHPGGHHRLVLERIDNIATAGRELTLSTVVTQKNIGDLPKIARFIDTLSAAGARLHAWHLYRFLPVGRGGLTASQELSVTRREFRKACEEVRGGDRKRAGRFRIYRRDNMLRSSSVEFFWFEGDRLRLGSQVRDSNDSIRPGAG